MVDPALHVEEHDAGDPDAPFVVLVHGLLDSSWSFGRVVEQLAPEYNVVTYDRRGWGRSVDAAPVSSFDDHVDDLVAVMNGRRGTVIGHSYGGAVSLVTASRRPDLVASLGVFEPSLSWTDFWPTRAFIREQRAHEAEHMEAGLERRPRRTREQAIREDALVEHEVGLLERISFDFSSVVVPRLVGRGGLSAPWRYGVIDRLCNELDADVVVVEGAGHTAHRAQPDGFADFARQAVALAGDPAVP
jgi:pimeloyl-ACP methyl ester carboxylesterase